MFAERLRLVRKIRHGCPMLPHPLTRTAHTLRKIFLQAVGKRGTQ